MQLRIVVMGVSGAGKSTVGRALADRLALPFIDGDDLHPAENVQKMASGIPLTDADRDPWLGRVGSSLHEGAGGRVIACSALKRSYRDVIRAAEPEVVFVELDGSKQLLAGRLHQRANHFMPAALLDSQLNTLEPLGADETGVRVDISRGVDDLVDDIVSRWNFG